MRFLFVKDEQCWPRASGHDVHVYHMMRELAALGHEIGLATAVRPAARALEGLTLADVWSWDKPAVAPRNGWTLTPWQRKFQSYLGVESAFIDFVGGCCDAFRPDVVVAARMAFLPVLAAIPPGIPRVWYAADDGMLLHLSQVLHDRRRAWHNLRCAAVNGLYEWTCGRLADRIWVVSEKDRRWVRRLTGVKSVDLVVNGVDTEYFRSARVPEIPRSLVFWGRLDFGPNQQALRWFLKHVWPGVRAEFPDAVFQVCGFNPSADLAAALAGAGVRLAANVPDLREAISAHSVAVLPFVSGGGIKNKLLEALSMERAVVASRRACNGLEGGKAAPLVQAGAGPEWIRALSRLWSDDEERRLLGQHGRAWVMERHSWRAAAESALAGLTTTEAVQSR